MGPIALRRPSDEKLIGVWEQQSNLPITYKNAGMTRGGPGQQTGNQMGVSRSPDEMRS